MHYEKTYAQLLASLPQELCENAIQYRQLKKIIKRIVDELSSLGLTQEVLHRLAADTGAPIHDTGLGVESFKLSGIRYELNDGKSTRIKPQLRMWVNIPPATSSKGVTLVDSKLEGHASLELSRLTGTPSFFPRQSVCTATVGQETIQEVVVPLVQEMEFYNILTTTLELVSSHLTTVQSDFLSSLRNLSDIISHSVHPTSAASKFHPHSALTANPGLVRVKISTLKSDLYSWREIFQLYLETEIFESLGEKTRGERSVEESEKRLQFFIEQLGRRGLLESRAFKMEDSAKALAIFLNLNLFILNIKKLSFANAEATRKILKKHAKQTALPLLLSSSNPMSASGVSQSLSYTTIFSLTRNLVQGIGETLIPIIPHIDDYSCLICTSIAFKPIRLNCRHIFCVRCLVKMQKSNKNLCPMCRAPCVLAANQNNVDWAMLNFMQDWFPLEAKEKLLSNEKEAAAEEVVELGYDPNACLLM